MRTNDNMNLIREYDNIRSKKGKQYLEVKDFKDEHKELVVFFGIADYIPRVWVDLDRILEIDKKEKITSRATKLNGSSKKLNTVPVIEALKDNEDQDFEVFDKLSEVILGVVRNLLKGNEDKIKRTLNTLESKKGRIMLSVVSAYCLGEELIRKFGTIEASKKLEVTIKTKKAYEEELREIFKKYEFDEAIKYFKDKIKDYGDKFLTTKKEVSRLVTEEFLYTIADKDSIDRFLSGIADRVRVEITGQSCLFYQDHF